MRHWGLKYVVVWATAVFESLAQLGKPEAVVVDLEWL